MTDKLPKLYKPTGRINYLITGSRHSEWINAMSEGMARSIFHQMFKGESIIQVVRVIDNRTLQRLPIMHCVLFVNCPRGYNRHIDCLYCPHSWFYDLKASQGNGFDE